MTDVDEVPEQLLTGFGRLLDHAAGGRPVDTLPLRAQTVACADQWRALADAAARRQWRPLRARQVTAVRAIVAFLDGLTPALDRLDVGDPAGARAAFGHNLHRTLEAGAGCDG